MPIDHEKKFVFVHIPKTAGTSILCSLFNVSVDRDDFVDCEKLSKEYQIKHLIGNENGYTRLHHYPLYKIAALQENLSDFFTFAFVRNPFDRLVSEYHFLRLDRSMPFDKFVLHLVRMVFELNKLEEWFSFHFLPQTKFVSLHGDICCDFLGRFESLEQDFRKVCDVLSVECHPLPQYKKSKRQHYREYYSAESRAVVEDLYSNDLDTFGYEF